MADFEIKRNDTYPPLEATLSDKNGVIDLTNAEKIHIYLKSETLLIKTGECKFVERAAGEIEYEWEDKVGEEPADLGTSGTYKMEFEITWKSGKISTVPNTGFKELKVVDDLN